jgi:hypothetical protein
MRACTRPPALTDSARSVLKIGTSRCEPRPPSDLRVAYNSLVLIHLTTTIDNQMFRVYYQFGCRGNNNNKRSWLVQNVTKSTMWPSLWRFHRQHRGVRGCISVSVCRPLFELYEDTVGVLIHLKAEECSYISKHGHMTWVSSYISSAFVRWESKLHRQYLLPLRAFYPVRDIRCTALWPFGPHTRLLKPRRNFNALCFSEPPPPLRA